MPQKVLDKIAVIACMAIVTAAVTLPAKRPARADGAPVYTIMIRDVKDASEVAHTNFNFTKEVCLAKIGNFNEVFDALADPDPEVKGPQIVADGELVDATVHLLVQSLGPNDKPPHWHMTCEVVGEPT